MNLRLIFSILYILLFEPAVSFLFLHINSGAAKFSDLCFNSNLKRGIAFSREQQGVNACRDDKAKRYSEMEARRILSVRET